MALLAFMVPQTVTDAIWQGVILLVGIIAAGLAVMFRQLGRQITQNIISFLELQEERSNSQRTELLEQAKRNAAGIEKLQDGGTKDAVKAALADTGLIGPKEGRRFDDEGNGGS